MHHKLILLLILLLSPAHVEPAWAGDTDGDSATSVAALAQQPTPAPPPRGTLYRIRYHHHTSYLFGTIHVGRPEFFPLEPQATKALSEADTLMLELDIRDTASLQSAAKKYGIYAGDDTLDKHLSPATLARLKQALVQIDVPYDNVAHMKAWMVANLLLVAALERQGYHNTLGTEMFLLTTAQAQGKKIQGLESADFQLSLFNGMNEEQQEQYLNENLADLESGVMLKNTQILIDAWASADQKTLDDLLQETQDDHSVGGTFMSHILLDQRNPEMADKIEALLKQDQASFVGIGLLHLLGSGGVPHLLAQRGYEVTRLY